MGAGDVQNSPRPGKIRLGLDRLARRRGTTVDMPSRRQTLVVRRRHLHPPDTGLGANAGVTRTTKAC
ncbi:hypothetical protein CHELA40_14918 [Chelatococcus asaccharovorans]|nr:hypothetical protein CHELA17_60704 [Chelatococcus asaccharovorans]CAH1680755.1 hypothetical protein CHELA40_14918 [Chelatococcus asaccharovorans]